MRLIVLISLLSNTVLESFGRNFSRCELAVELLRHGFPIHQLDHWVCLIEAESSFRTDAVGGPDDDGSYDYGLFQINSRYWCSTGQERGKTCNLRCDGIYDMGQVPEINGIIILSGNGQATFVEGLMAALETSCSRLDTVSTKPSDEKDGWNKLRRQTENWLLMGDIPMERPRFSSGQV